MNKLIFNLGQLVKVGYKHYVIKDVKVGEDGNTQYGVINDKGEMEYHLAREIELPW